MSHFFPSGDERHFNSIYLRPEDRTQEFWADPTVKTRYTKPIYVLTSEATFSGGEELAYNVQTQERGTLIGEVTGGGANPGGPVPLAHGFVAFISFGRAINPITGTNWEHIGVSPDIVTSADDALGTAYRMAIEARLDGEDSEMTKGRLQQLLERLNTGDLPLPAWEDPRKLAF